MSDSKIKEGLAAIAREVLGDVEKEAEKIIQQAEKEANEALDDAKREADKTYNNILEEVSEKIGAEKKRIQSLTDVDARNVWLAVKEDLVNEAFKDASAKLLKLADSQRYHEYLTSSISAIAKRIGSKEVVIQVSSADRAWLEKGRIEKLSEKTGIHFTLSSEPVSSVGGFRIQTKNGKKTIDSTFESRLEQLRPELRQKTAELLQSKEEQPNAS